MKYEYKDINLREQAEHVVEDLRADATKRGLMLLFKTDLSCKGIVNADFGKTQQILHNLINNALKYTRQGTVTVLVKKTIRLPKLLMWNLSILESECQKKH